MPPSIDTMNITKSMMVLEAVGKISEAIRCDDYFYFYAYGWVGGWIMGQNKAIWVAISIYEPSEGSCSDKDETIRFPSQAYTVTDA